MAKTVGYTEEENLRDAAALSRDVRGARRAAGAARSAAIHGAALGGGAGLAAVCDIVVADERRASSGSPR